MWNVIRKIIFVIVLFVLFDSCIRDERLSNNSSLTESDELKNNRKIWKELNTLGDYDSLIRFTAPKFKAYLCSKDTLGIVYSGAFMAQAYTFKENVDSVRYYLDTIQKYYPNSLNAELASLIYNVKGIFAIKTELDYSVALESFKKGYETMCTVGDINNRMAFLLNIVSLFYVQSDILGMRYAQEAFSLSQQDDVDNFSKCSSVIAVAQMKSLSSNPDDIKEAVSMLESISEMVNNEGYTSLKPMIHLILADCYKFNGQLDFAEYNYSQALQYSSCCEPGIVSKILLNYASLCEMNKDWGKAILLYKDGLETSYSSGNIEYRRVLLRKITKAYQNVNDSLNTLKYAQEYILHTDSISDIEKEKRFGKLLMLYQESEHNNEIRSAELALVKANRSMIIAGAVIIIISILFIFLWVTYSRQKATYRKLVNQHQNYLRRLENKENTSIDSSSDEDSKELFSRIEELMKNGLYKNNGISLDMIAEKLDTNRFYVSKAINNHSKMSFFAYVNMYRINEATRIMSKGEGRVLFKQLADELGYNSAEVFTKAFQKETGVTPSKYYREIVAQNKKISDKS